HNQHEDKHDCEDQTADQTEIRVFHRLNLTANVNEGPTGQRLLVGSNEFVDSFAHRTQITALHCTGDIQCAADVVAIDDLPLGASAGCCCVSRNLGLLVFLRWHWH